MENREGYRPGNRRPYLYERLREEEYYETKLVEADGGLWKNGTMKKIKEYLEFELRDELEKHHITVIA